MCACIHVCFSLAIILIILYALWLRILSTGTEVDTQKVCLVIPRWLKYKGKWSLNFREQNRYVGFDVTRHRWRWMTCTKSEWKTCCTDKADEKQERVDDMQEFSSARRSVHDATVILWASQSYEPTIQASSQQSRCMSRKNSRGFLSLMLPTNHASHSCFLHRLFERKDTRHGERLDSLLSHYTCMHARHLAIISSWLDSASLPCRLFPARFHKLYQHFSITCSVLLLDGGQGARRGTDGRKAWFVSVTKPTACLCLMRD